MALLKKGKPLFGVILDLDTQKTYVGSKNGNAFYGNKPIFVSQEKSPDQAVIATGFPLNRNYNDESISNFISNVQKFKKIRMIGSAGMSLALVACGVFDAYFEEDIMIWDVAAGLALVKAAGGKFKLKKGRKKHSVICCATNSKIPINEIMNY